jgi:hypothetical protein
MVNPSQKRRRKGGKGKKKDKKILAEISKVICPFKNIALVLGWLLRL